jgi:hypothetical protein
LSAGDHPLFHTGQRSSQPAGLHAAMPHRPLYRRNSVDGGSFLERGGQSHGQSHGHGHGYGHGYGPAHGRGHSSGHGHGHGLGNGTGANWSLGGNVHQADMLDAAMNGLNLGRSEPQNVYASDATLFELQMQQVQLQQQQAARLRELQQAHQRHSQSQLLNGPMTSQAMPPHSGDSGMSSPQAQGRTSHMMPMMGNAHATMYSGSNSPDAWNTATIPSTASAGAMAMDDGFRTPPRAGQTMHFAEIHGAGNTSPRSFQEHNQNGGAPHLYIHQDALLDASRSHSAPVSPFRRGGGGGNGRSQDDRGGRGGRRYVDVESGI